MMLHLNYRNADYRNVHYDNAIINSSISDVEVTVLYKASTIIIKASIRKRHLHTPAIYPQEIYKQHPHLSQFDELSS